MLASALLCANRSRVMNLVPIPDFYQESDAYNCREGKPQDITLSATGDDRGAHKGPRELPTFPPT